MQKVARLLGLATMSVAMLATGGCGGGSGGGGDDGNGNNPPVDTDITFELLGKVVAPDSGGADITVSVGGQSFSGKADDQGNYRISLSIPQSAAELPLALISKLIDERSYIELSSNLGKVNEIAADAGPDGVLDFDENPRTNLSTFWTAEAALLAKVTGNTTKGAEFAGSVDPNEALKLAAALELVIADPVTFALPQGTSTTLQLAQNATASASFVANLVTNAPRSLENATQEILGEPDIVGQPQPADAVGTTIAVDLQTARDFCNGNCPEAQAFDFAADGSAEYYTEYENLKGTWEINGTRTQFRFLQPLVSTYDTFLDCDGDGVTDAQPVTETYTYFGNDVVSLSATAVGITDIARQSRSNCPNVPDEDNRSTRAYRRITNQRVPFSTAELAATRWALPVPDPAYGERLGDNILVTDLLDLQADGSTQARFLSAAPAWSVSGGDVILEQPGVYSGRVRRLESLDSVASLVLAEYTLESVKFISLSYAFRGDRTVQFVQAQVPGRYFFDGLGPDRVEAAESGDDPRLQGARVRLDPDGRGELEFDAIENGEYVVSTSSRKVVQWEVAAADELTYLRARNANDGSAFCTPGDTNCLLFARVRLALANRVGDRLYTVRERKTLDETVDGSLAATALSALVFDYAPLQGR